MFSSRNSQLGAWEWVVPVVKSVIEAGSTVASALVQSNAAKKIAQYQSEAQKAIAQANEANAQLQLKQLEAILSGTSLLNTSTAMRLSPEYLSSQQETSAPRQEFYNIPGIGPVEKNKALLYGGGILILLLLLRE